MDEARFVMDTFKLDRVEHENNIKRLERLIFEKEEALDTLK